MLGGSAYARVSLMLGGSAYARVGLMLGGSAYARVSLMLGGSAYARVSLMLGGSASNLSEFNVGFTCLVSLATVRGGTSFLCPTATKKQKQRKRLQTPAFR
jgi:hypothetical protein